MIPLRRHILLKAFMLFDMVIMLISFGLTAWAFSNGFGTISVGQLLSMRVKVQTVAFFLCFVLAWHIVFSLFGLYRSRRLSARWSESVDIFKAASLGSLLLFIIAMLFDIDKITPAFLVVFWAVSGVITLLSRLMLRRGLAWVRTRGLNLRFVLILGTNARAVQLARIIEAKQELGYCLVGFMDETWKGTKEFLKAGYPLLGDLEEFPSFARDRAVDEVWIGLPMESFSKKLSRAIDFCQKSGVITRFFPNGFDSNMARLRLEEFEENSVIIQYSSAMRGWAFLVKRTMDTSISLILLIFFSPLFLIAALLIKITSPGPVFFIQDRVGFHRRRFRLYKFRTMTRDAEQRLPELEHLNEVSGPVFKIKDDPRITRVGKCLRKTSIDELPQLINVLIGDMSLVGPRPLPVRDYKGFYHDRHRRRLSVPPGITCFWQINGRNTIPFEKWMELDLQYIDQWSLWLDLKILVKTIPAVFKGS